MIILFKYDNRILINSNKNTNLKLIISDIFSLRIIIINEIKLNKFISF